MAAAVQPSPPAFNPLASEEPLVSGFGLAATEKGFPGKPFEGFLTKGGDAGLVVQPHAGEEWHEDACMNILGAVEAGATRIGHGIHSLVKADDLPADVKVQLEKHGCLTLVELLKAKGVTCELCTTSNDLIVSTEEERLYGAVLPVKQLVDQGVHVVLGSDDAGAWDATGRYLAPRPCQREGVMQNEGSSAACPA